MKRFIILFIITIAGAILFESFQCASPQMTSAKLALRSHQYEKAETNLAKELSKVPLNGEANLMMAEVKLKLNKIEEVGKYILAADKIISDPKIRPRIPLVKNRLWIVCYNKSINTYNKYYTTQNKTLLDTVIHFLDIALEIRPKMSDFYRLKGKAYEDLEQPKKAIEIYKKYVEIIDNEIQFAKQTQTYIMKPRDEIISKMGKPANTFAEASNSSGDSMLTDLYKVFGRNVYLFYAEDDNKIFVLEGWRVNPPADWLPGEKKQWAPLFINPLAAIAESYFNLATDAKNNSSLDSSEKVYEINLNFEEAKKYTKILLVLSPTHIDANRFLVNIYEVQGKSEEALQEIENLVKMNPNNKIYLSQLAEINLRLENYDAAIDNYTKALKIDPGYCDVTRNLAATYKNKAVKILRKQQDIMMKDKTYKENPDEYMPLLKKSAEYFTQARNCSKYKNDFLVLSELANLYISLNDKSKQNEIIDALERIEQTIPDDQKEHYWLGMCKIYGDLKLNDKANKACAEAGKY